MRENKKAYEQSITSLDVARCSCGALHIRSQDHEMSDLKSLIKNIQELRV